MRPLAFLALALLAAPAAGQMVKCQDARGVWHYTDVPPPGCKGREVDIRGQPPIGGQLTPQKEDLDRQNAEFQRRRIERERAWEKNRAEQERRCAAAKQELVRLETQRRIPDGKGGFMDDAEREQRTAAAREQLRGC